MKSTFKSIWNNHTNDWINGSYIFVIVVSNKVGIWYTRKIPKYTYNDKYEVFVEITRGETTIYW